MIQQFLKKHDACKEGYEWAIRNCKDMNDVWDTCRDEWLIWLATREGVLTTQELQRFALFGANSVKHLMRDKRSLKALEVIERYLEDNATKEDLADAARAAADAARAVGAAVVAANAAWAARAAWAAWAAADAAWAAEAAAGATAEAAWAAAWAAAGAAKAAGEREKQARFIRENFKPTFDI